MDAIIEALSAFRNNANNDLVDRTSLVSSVQSEEGNTDTYFVKARVDRGRGLSDALLQSMDNIVGKERASKIVSGMEQGDYFGKYGKHDMQIEFTPKGGEVFVKMQYIDPNNGRPTRFRECSLPVFREEFGDIFASSEQE